MTSTEELEQRKLFLKLLQHFKCSRNDNQSLYQPHKGNAILLFKILKTSERGKVTSWRKQLSQCLKRENDWNVFLSRCNHKEHVCVTASHAAKKQGLAGLNCWGTLPCHPGVAKSGISLPEMPGPSPWAERMFSAEGAPGDYPAVLGCVELPCTVLANKPSPSW